MRTLNEGFNISQGNIEKKKYGYKNYALGKEYHIVKTNKDNSCDYKSNFEIIPNYTRSEGESHIQTTEFEKSTKRRLERSKLR